MSSAATSRNFSWSVGFGFTSVTECVWWNNAFISLKALLYGNYDLNLGSRYKADFCIYDFHIKADALWILEHWNMMLSKINVICYQILQSTNDWWMLNFF